MQQRPTPVWSAFGWLRQPSRLAFAVASATLALLAPAAASDLSVKGSALAAEHCSPCHGVGIDDDSPHKVTPPLRKLAAEYPIPMLVEALKTGVIGGHDEMPMFDLGVDETRALIAYIDSLNPKGPQYLGKSKP